MSESESEYSIKRQPRWSRGSFTITTADGVDRRISYGATMEELVTQIKSLGFAVVLDDIGREVESEVFSDG